MEQLLIMRGLERLIIQAGAIVLVVVGALLFKWGISGAASLSAEGRGIRFSLLNAAPGLFFALFGMAVMGVGTWRQLTYDSIVLDATKGTAKYETFHYSDDAVNEFCDLLDAIDRVRGEEASVIEAELNSLAEDIHQCKLNLCR